MNVDGKYIVDSKVVQRPTSCGGIVGVKSEMCALQNIFLFMFIFGNEHNGSCFDRYVGRDMLF